MIKVMWHNSTVYTVYNKQTGNAIFSCKDIRSVACGLFKRNLTKDQVQVIFTRTNEDGNVIENLVINV